MSLLQKAFRGNIEPRPDPTKQEPLSIGENSDLLKFLTVVEIETILRTLSTSTCPVKDIEVIYSGIYKLQVLRDKIVINGK